MSHPKLGSLGEEIIKDIMEIADEGKQRSHVLGRADVSSSEHEIPQQNLRVDE